MRFAYVMVMLAVVLGSCVRGASTLMTPFDPKRREARVALVREASRDAPDHVIPAVTLEAFFNGNRDPASIGCNLDPHPRISRFREVLLEIRQRSGVQDVLVGVHNVSDPDSWPFSETVYVLTSAAGSEVEK